MCPGTGGSGAFWVRWALFWGPDDCTVRDGCTRGLKKGGAPACMRATGGPSMNPSMKDVAHQGIGPRACSRACEQVPPQANTSNMYQTWGCAVGAPAVGAGCNAARVPVCCTLVPHCGVEPEPDDRVCQPDCWSSPCMTGPPRSTVRTLPSTKCRTCTAMVQGNTMQQVLAWEVNGN